MRRGGRGAEEGAERRTGGEAPCIRDRDSVEACHIGLGAILACREVDARRPARAERLDVVETWVADVDGGNGHYLVERWMAEDAAFGGHVLERAGTKTEEFQAPRLAAAEAIDEYVRDRVCVALVQHRDDLDRILRTDLAVVAHCDDVQVLVEKEEVVVVGRS